MVTSFAEAPEDVYLPFLERPSEVATLISEPNNAKLLKLLEFSLPKPSQNTQDSDLPDDPAEWTGGHLRYWMTRVDRKEADDFVWVRKMRDAIHPHSELIWQRLKEVLGVPVDFDVDEDNDGSNTPSSVTPSPSTPDLHVFPDAFSPSMERQLDIEPIRAKPPSPSESLHEIKEDEPTVIENATDALYGLRISLPASDFPAKLAKPISPHNMSDSTSAMTYDALEERGPGNPLFPSNFTGVALAPTLPAK